MAEHKPKFNSAQDSFFKELLPEEFTPQKPLVKNSSDDNNLDKFLDHMHNIHQTSRLRTSVAYNDYIKTEHRPRKRKRTKAKLGE